MVGLMVLTWAWAENSLAMTIGVINKNAGPIKGHPEAPLSLKKRVNCFRIALRDIPALKPLQEEGRALAVRFTELGARRNNFIHGAAWQLEQGGFQSMVFAVMGGKYIVKDHRFDEDDAFLFNVEITKLQAEIADFMLRVAAIFGN